MPPTKDIGKAIESIMQPFYEGQEEPSGNEFYDWYVIGGRWAGTKETCGYAKEKMDSFYGALKENKVTVSGLQSGKQTISPAQQIPMVDKLWNSFFPTENGEIIPCPLFDHSNNQYNSDDLLSCDICLVEEIPKNLKASRVIVAGPKYNDMGVEATFMISDDFWNGVNFVKTTWDGNVLSALEMMKEKMNGYREEYKEKISPKPNWICITVDYHS